MVGGIDRTGSKAPEANFSKRKTGIELPAHFGVDIPGLHLSSSATRRWRSCVASRELRYWWHPTLEHWWKRCQSSRASADNHVDDESSNFVLWSLFLKLKIRFVRHKIQLRAVEQLTIECHRLCCFIDRSELQKRKVFIEIYLTSQNRISDCLG